MDLLPLSTLNARLKVKVIIINFSTIKLDNQKCIMYDIDISLHLEVS